MDKSRLSESDLCDKFIRPALERADWDGMTQIYREYPLRAGRVVVRGRQARRDASTVLRADFVLFHKANIPLAVHASQHDKTRFEFPMPSARPGIRWTGWCARPWRNRRLRSHCDG